MKENPYLKIANNEMVDVEDLRDYRKDRFNTTSHTKRFVEVALFPLTVGLLYSLLKSIQTQNNYAILITALLLMFISLIFLWLLKPISNFLQVVENEYLFYLEAKKLIKEKKK